MRRLLLVLTLLLASCAFEGDEPGDCTDRADNDRDGLFDCEDDGCAGSPDCAGDDDDAIDDDDDDATDDDDDADVEWVESRSAVVDISAPNYGYDLATELGLVTIEGVAREDVEIVTWETDRGASGTAEGVQVWVAEDIPLAAGDNVITITGTTGDGETGADVMVVTYSSDVPFASGLTLSTTAVVAGSVLQQLSASVLLTSTDGMTDAVVGPTDADGALLESWATLVESEDTPGLLTASIELSESQVTSYELRAVVAFGAATGRTPPVTLSVVEQLGMDDASALATLANEATEVLQDAEPWIDPLAARQAVVAWLLQQPGISSAGTSDDDGYGLWWIVDPGIPFIMYTTTVGRGGPAVDLRRRDLPRTVYPSSGVGAPRGWTRSSAGVVGRAPKAEPRQATAVVGSNIATALAPFYSEFGTTDETIEVAALFAGMTCPRVSAAGAYANGDADMNRFGDIVENGLVVVSSHGDSYFSGARVPETFGWNGPGGQVAVLTRHMADASEIPVWQPQLSAGQMAVAVPADGIPVFAILPSFIPGQVAAYGQPMPENSVVGIASCRSAWNDSLVSAFLSSGAGFFFGFTDYVQSSYAYDRALLFWQGLLLYGDTTGDAWTSAEYPLDPDDAITPALPLSWGDTGIQLGNGPLSDGGFEYGASEWLWETDSPAGYYDISGAIYGVPDTSAPEGSSFIHGMTEAPDSVYVSWKQKWCPVPDLPVTVSFWWQVLTEDWDCNPYGDPNWLNLRHDRIEGNQTKWMVQLEDFCSSMDVQGDIMGTDWQFHSFTFTPEVTDYPGDQYLSFSIGGYDGSEWWGLIDGVDVVQ